MSHINYPRLKLNPKKVKTKKPPRRIRNQKNYLTNPKHSWLVSVWNKSKGETFCEPFGNFIADITNHNVRYVVSVYNGEEVQDILNSAKNENKALQKGYKFFKIKYKDDESIKQVYNEILELRK